MKGHNPGSDNPADSTRARLGRCRDDEGHEARAAVDRFVRLWCARVSALPTRRERRSRRRGREIARQIAVEMHAEAGRL